MVFEDVTSATNSLKQLNDFPFYDKPMRVSYAKTKSDATSKCDGTFDPQVRDPEIRQKRKAESQESEKKSQEAKKDSKKGAATSASAADTSAPPNEILFVEGLPGTSFFFRVFGLWFIRVRVYTLIDPDYLNPETPSNDSLTQPIKLSDARG